MNQVEASTPPETIWQVEVGGQIYEAKFEELPQWIAEGSLQPTDKVRRGNLRWLEANKIPALYGFFNAKELGLPIPPVVSTASNETVRTTGNPTIQTENFNSSQTQNSQQTNYAQIENTQQTPQDNSFESLNFDPIRTDLCCAHPQEQSHFVCLGCGNGFCKTCPKSYGGTVKICPMCGGMCKPVSEVLQKQQKGYQYQQAFAEGFGFEDFGKAIAYPFKFKFSLISGAILFMFFTLGQSAGAMGSIFLVVGAIFCFMLANTLTFGIMANTVENFSHGKTDENFMPSFDDFNLWDDVIHPFILSIGTYLVSFGLLFAIILGGIYFAWKSIESAPASDTTWNQTFDKMKEGNAQQNQSGAMTPEQAKALSDQNAEKFQELEKQLRQSQAQQQQEALGGSSPDTGKMVAGLAKYGGIFVIAVLLALGWGLFYFPAACTVAGYTRSFAATVNPTVGLDTIKRFGVDYVKILVFTLMIFVFAGIINYMLGMILSPFDLPRMGNLAAKAFGSLFSFYFSVVFSVILGYALYKNSAKFNLSGS